MDTIQPLIHGGRRRRQVEQGMPHSFEHHRTGCRHRRRRIYDPLQRRHAGPVDVGLKQIAGLGSGTFQGIYVARCPTDQLGGQFGAFRLERPHGRDKGIVTAVWFTGRGFCDNLRRRGVNGRVRCSATPKKETTMAMTKSEYHLKSIGYLVFAGILATVCCVAPIYAAESAGFWDEVKKTSKKAWKDVKETGKEIPGEVADDAKDAWSGVKKTGKKAGQETTRQVKKVPEDTKRGLKEAREAN